MQKTAFSIGSLRSGIRIVLMTLVTGLILGGCGSNIYEKMVKKDSGVSRWENARMLLDKKQYAAAREEIQKVASDSNEKRILLVSASLGEVGLSMWDIILEITEKALSSSARSGLDNVFDLIGESIFGAGTDRTSRVGALQAGIETLREAPDPSLKSVRNLACFLAGVLTLPSVIDGNAAISGLTTSLATIEQALKNAPGGLTECPDLTNLQNSITKVAEVSQSFSLILQQIDGCNLFNMTEAAANLNKIEAKLITFMAHADQGCREQPVCQGLPFCNAIGLKCVSDLVNSGVDTAVAGDGIISSCEIIQNCLNPASCFSL
jgi:hypothetical protein